VNSYIHIKKYSIVEIKKVEIIRIRIIYKMYIRRQNTISNPVQKWQRYYDRGRRQGISDRTIMTQWMLYACQNFVHDESEGTLFVDRLFRYAKFTQEEKLDAIEICRSPHFLYKLSHERRILIIEATRRYDNHNYLSEIMEQERQRMEQDRQRMEQDRQRRVDLIFDNLIHEQERLFQVSSDDDEYWVIFPRPLQAEPRPLQAVPLPIEEEEDFGDDIPPDFVCPLSLSIMKEPVMASDGHTYEKDKIQTWTLQKKISPISRAELLPHFFPNLLLKNKIDDWKESYRKAKTEAEVNESI